MQMFPTITADFNENESCKILVCSHTANQSRVFLCWSGPAPAAEPVCRPRRYVAETEQAAPRRGKDAAPAGGRSETETPGIDCARHCSGKREKISPITMHVLVKQVCDKPFTSY